MKMQFVVEVEAIASVGTVADELRSLLHGWFGELTITPSYATTLLADDNRNNNGCMIYKTEQSE